MLQIKWWRGWDYLQQVIAGYWYLSSRLYPVCYYKFGGKIEIVAAAHLNDPTVFCYRFIIFTLSLHLNPHIPRLNQLYSGLTDEEIKAKFGVKDKRTLDRHFKLAEQEREVRLARVEIAKDAIGKHLAEVLKVIEQWQDSLHAPPCSNLHTHSIADILYRG